MLYNTCCNQFGGNQLFVCHVMFHVCFSIHIAPKTISYWLPMVSPFITYSSPINVNIHLDEPHGSPVEVLLAIPSCDHPAAILCFRWTCWCRGISDFEDFKWSWVKMFWKKHEKTKTWLGKSRDLTPDLHCSNGVAVKCLEEIGCLTFEWQKIGIQLSMIEISSREMWTERKHGCYATHMKMFSC